MLSSRASWYMHMRNGVQLRRQPLLSKEASLASSTSEAGHQHWLRDETHGKYTENQLLLAGRRDCKMKFNATCGILTTSSESSSSTTLFSQGHARRNEIYTSHSGAHYCTGRGVPYGRW